MGKQTKKQKAQAKKQAQEQRKRAKKQDTGHSQPSRRTNAQGATRQSAHPPATPDESPSTPAPRRAWPSISGGSWLGIASLVVGLPGLAVLYLVVQPSVALPTVDNEKPLSRPFTIANDRQPLYTLRSVHVLCHVRDLITSANERIWGNGTLEDETTGDLAPNTSRSFHCAANRMFNFTGKVLEANIDFTIQYRVRWLPGWTTAYESEWKFRLRRGSNGEAYWAAGALGDAPPPPLAE